MDHCVEAKRLPDTLDGPFISYLLAVAIYETRHAMRQQMQDTAKGAPRPAERRHVRDAG